MMNLRNLLKFEFKKTLPSEFGSAKILVTGRADRRVLKFGWNGAAFDLMLVSRNLVREGMVVWDIGANQGIFSFLAAFKAGPHGRVFALEADPHYADMIFRSSCLLGRKYAKVDVLCAAISDQQSILTFCTSSAGHARNKLLNYGTNDDFQAEHAKMVPSFRGDDLLDCWEKPQVVKVDVEGAELSALKGCDKLLRDVRPVFYIEVSKENEIPVSDLFHSYDYDIFHLKGDGSEQLIDICSFYTIARPRLAPK